MAHVIWKSFSFHFIQMKKKSQNISGIQVVKENIVSMEKEYGIDNNKREEMYNAWA